MRTWSQTRLATAVALCSWAALFWFLILDGRVPLYLSPRTTWLAYLGAVTSTVGAIGYVMFARTDAREPLTMRGIGALATFLIPVVLLLSLPPITLGSFASSRRTNFVAQGVVAPPEGDISSGELSLLDVAGALRSPEGSDALAARAGTEVSFIGFVDRDQGQPADEFTLTRFLITCCPGDALTVQVRVVGAPPGKFKADDWVRVTGALYPLGQEAIVEASDVVSVPRPQHPYLSS
jgi:uncharacterized repeat protein (TIGR03943 family)